MLIRTRALLSMPATLAALSISRRIGLALLVSELGQHCMSDTPAALSIFRIGLVGLNWGNTVCLTHQLP